MKIIYITEQLYIHGGAEKILSQKLNYWAEVYDYEVLLITSEQKNNPVCYPLSKKINHIDLKINYAEGTSYFSLSNLSKFPKHYKSLKHVIIDFNPDAIFLISLSWIRIVLPILARRYNIYNEYHTSFYGFKLKYDQKNLFGKLKEKVWNFFVLIAEKSFTKIIFLNKEELNFYNKKNGIIIPNFFEEIDNNVNHIKKNQVIALGRLSYQKGFDLLIEAWGKIDNKINNWSLIIYGNGENKQQLVDKVQNLKLKNHIEINDAISNVHEKLAESKIYAMSSRYETFPMVLLEALSHGLPIVSFDCPTGPRSIITENEDGILVKNNNIDDLAKKILFLINNNELRDKMSLKAKTNINRFKPRYVMNIWDELIKINNINK